MERFGRVDALISNAGVLSPNGRIHNLSTDDWRRAFDVNVLGAVNGIRAAVGVMRPQGSGSIVLTASVSGLTAWSHAAPYCATKAAVIQLAKVAAVEYARDGIRSEEHTSELQSLMRISYAVFCLKKKNHTIT